MTALTVFAAVVAYGVGMFPTAVLVGRFIGHHPIREGSGNPGASNMYRIGGCKAGLVVVIIDLAKGAAPTLAVLLLWGREAALAAWLGSVIGHIWPALGRMRGGKGVATWSGGAIVLDPVIGCMCLAVFAVVVRVTHVAALGSLSIGMGYTVLVAVTGWPLQDVVVAVVVMGLVILRHRSNITRLWRGTELEV